MSTPDNAFNSFLKSATLVAIPSVSKPASSNSVEAALNLNAIVLIPFPTISGSCTTSLPATIKPKLSDNVLFADDREEADFCNAVPIPPDEIENLFETSLNLSTIV